MKGCMLLGALALGFFTTAVRADTPEAAPALLPVKVQKGITFATVGKEKLQLDIAMPQAGGPYPAVVVFHGGAWRSGSRADLSRNGKDAAGRPVASLIEMIAARGYVVATASYRLAPEHHFPAQIEDARAAVRFLRTNAATYHLDPDKIAAGGFSAGGHLALLLGLNPPAVPDPTDADTPSARVQAVVSFFGPTDLSLYTASEGLMDGYMVPFLGKKAKTDPEVIRRASPIEFVSKDDPPVLMVHGTADFIVPVIHSERLLKKLEGAGVTAELVKVPGAGHGWGGEELTKTIADAVRFLDEHLKGKK